MKAKILYNGAPLSITVQRHQLPLQLAFACTAHGAQGRTLSSVASNLNFGGTKAYVVASRARTREGLVLTEPVQLRHLNTRCPGDLTLETARLAALEHNTLVKLHRLPGPLIPVPNPEGNLVPQSVTWQIKGPSRTPIVSGVLG